MQNSVLIFGVGNILMGDEGIGVHVIKTLEKKSFPSNIVLLDGGTGGFHLLSYFQEYPTIIMIDATMDGKPPGTISTIQPRFASDYPSALSSHDIGLKDLIESVSLLGLTPKIYLITIAISEIQSMKLELSPEIFKIIPNVISEIMQLLNHILKTE